MPIPTLPNLHPVPNDAANVRDASPAATRTVDALERAVCDVLKNKPTTSDIVALSTVAFQIDAFRQPRAPHQNPVADLEPLLDKFYAYMLKFMKPAAPPATKARKKARKPASSRRAT